MQVILNIPKEFESHFCKDRFEDSLHRLSADAHLLAGNYEQEVVVMLIEAFKNAMSVSPHGDLIDRDEMIHDIEKAITPSWYIKKRNDDMVKFLSLADAIIPADVTDTNVGNICSGRGKPLPYEG